MSCCWIRVISSFPLLNAPAPSKVDKRQEAIAELWKENRIERALDASPHEVSVHTVWLRKIAKEHWIDDPQTTSLPPARCRRSRGKGVGALQCWSPHKILWNGFEKPAYPLNADRLASRIELLEITNPLRKLTGAHFRGRIDELRKLQSHVEASTALPHIITPHGTGGVGKSALLGKLLLERDAPLDDPRLWAYLDFDDPKVDPINPRRLIELVARQLALLFARRVETTTLQALESSAAGDAQLAFTLNLGPDATPTELLKALNRRIRDLSTGRSFILVLDTFELVQVRGDRVVPVMWEFLAGDVRTDAICESLSSRDGRRSRSGRKSRRLKLWVARSG